jgi:hypothetical protein
MRVGLLTRFMGVLGAIGGVLFILPLTPLPLVQVFWFIAAGALYLGKSGSGQGMPQAWTTGESVPWPSQQEIREAKLAARAERQGGGGSRPSGRGGGAATKEKAAPASTNGKGRGRPSLPETPAPQAPKGVPHSSSKKKKRKRR